MLAQSELIYGAPRYGGRALARAGGKSAQFLPPSSAIAVTTMPLLSLARRHRS